MESRKSPSTQNRRPAKRSWKTSSILGIATVGVGVLPSATVNPLPGRQVSWDWMAGLVPIMLIVIVLTLRNKWI